MKILITGSSGYIGSHLTHRLLRDGHQIHGLDIVQPVIEPTKFICADIRNLGQWSEHYDAVVHLAALANVSESVRIPSQYYITNVNGTMNVLDIPTNNFILASTGAAEYAESPYAISKRMCESIVRELSRSEYTMFRFYNVTGMTVTTPTNPDGLLYNLIKAKTTGKFTIFGDDYNTFDGTCIRDYVHVMEICEAINTALYSPSNSLESLGHGIGKSVIEIVDLFKKVNDVNFDIEYAPRRRGDLAFNVLSNVSSYMKNLYSFDELLRV